jgi:hypothetical protein
MAENKTQPSTKSVAAFIAAIENDGRRKDAKALLKMMQEVTCEKPVMWGPSIIGFGSYHYIYDSGREGDMCMLGFSPRSSSISLYMTNNYKENEALKKKLGKHKPSKGCLYINKLADIDEGVLRQMIEKSWAAMKKKYG